MHSQPNKNSRRGVAAVEFAFVVPVLMSIVFGLIQVTRVYDAQNLLESAAREGARFASIDRDGMLGDGETANTKLVSDVKNFMASAGLSRDDVQVSIRDHANPESTFDLDDPANDLKLFDVEVSVPYSSVSYTPIGDADNYSMSASITFRNGRATLSQ